MILIILITVIMTVVSAYLLILFHEVVFKIVRIFKHKMTTNTWINMWDSTIGRIIMFLLNMGVSSFLMNFTGRGMTAGIANLFASIVISLLTKPIVTRALNNV